MDKKLKIVVLAAGKGTRLQSENSDVPKVMRQVCGKPLLWYVLEALPVTDKQDVIIVVGYGKDKVMEYFDGYRFATQEKQLGTGHAVMAAAEQLGGFDGPVLVCYGDMPLVKRETYETFVNEHFETGNDCTILTAKTADPKGLGRVVRNNDGEFVRVVEDRDCDSEELKITEINTGVYVFNTPRLLNALKQLKNENDQGEYYLPDVAEIMLNSGEKAGLFKRNMGDELIGVNTVEQLNQVEEILINSDYFG